MASVTKDTKGWRIRFVDKNGDRKTIRPGRGTNKATAEQIGRHCDILVSASASSGVLARTTALWLGDIGDRLHGKLSRTGIIEPRDSGAVETELSFAVFMEQFIADGITSKGNQASESTLKKWRTARNHLVAFFGETLSIGSIKRSDARKFRKYLDRRRIKKTRSNPTGQPMQENSKRKIIATTKAMLNAAKRPELVERNAFDSEVSSSRPNRSRDFFVTAEMTSAILEACPDVQWRLMFALWRLAALRKMEIFELRWDHILWDQGKMLVPSPKTARHLGRENRFVPLGGIEPYLRSAFEAANDGVERVITRYSESNCNLDKPFGKILVLAGYKPWPKLFQNLRSSCETEWLDYGFPAHVVACWVGHTVKVQNDHYAQIDQHHFEDFNSKVAEKVAHTLGELGRMPANDYEKRPAKNQCFRGPSSQFVTMRGNSDAPERSRTSTSITDT